MERVFESRKVLYNNINLLLFIMIILNFIIFYIFIGFRNKMKKKMIIMICIIIVVDLSLIFLGKDSLRVNLNIKKNFLGKIGLNNTNI